MSRFNSWVAGARVKFLAEGNTAAAGNRTQAPNLEPHDYQAGALPTELLLPPNNVCHYCCCCPLRCVCTSIELFMSKIQTIIIRYTFCEDIIPYAYNVGIPYEYTNMGYPNTLMGKTRVQNRTILSPALSLADVILLLHYNINKKLNQSVHFLHGQIL